MTRPSLVILVGHQSSQAAKALSELEMYSVVFVETVCYNEDVQAQVFIERLYGCISKGLALEESCSIANKHCKDVCSESESLCCCLHPHLPGCLWV